MRDPHVESLTYRLETAEGIHFDSPPALVGDETGYSHRLENDRLTVLFSNHISSEEAAHVQVEPILKAWELQGYLETSKRQF